MNAWLNPDQEELRAVVGRFLSKTQDIGAVRSATETREGYDIRLWNRMSTELALTGVGMPESAGGSGESLKDLVVVCEQLGRFLDPSPFFTSVVLVGRALALCGDQDSWLARIVEGTEISSLAVLESSDPVGTSVCTVGEWREGRLSVTGAKRFVAHGARVDSFLMLVTMPEGPTLVRVAADATGLQVSPLEAVDRTRPLADLELTDVPATVVGLVGDADRVIDHVLAGARVALAAEQLGVAQSALDLVVKHVNERQQFGRPIGSYQSIKHMLADVMLEIESARTAVLHTADGLDASAPDAPVMSHVCQAVASNAVMLAAKACLQGHGAIGYTWEHDAHLYLKRAMSSHQLLGTPQQHRVAIAHVLLGPALGLEALV